MRVWAFEFSWTGGPDVSRKKNWVPCPRFLRAGILLRFLSRPVPHSSRSTPYVSRTVCGTKRGKFLVLRPAKPTPAAGACCGRRKSEARSNLYADFFTLALRRRREVPRPFAVLATVRVLAFSSTIFRRLRPPPLPFHRFPQELVDPCLVTTPLPLQPRQHIGVHADRHRPFDGTVKLPHHRASPFPHFRRIRQIDFLVRHARQRSQFLCLLPRGLLHRSSFPAASPFRPEIVRLPSFPPPLSELYPCVFFLLRAHSNQFARVRILVLYMDLTNLIIHGIVSREFSTPSSRNRCFSA